jgi:Porphobilinogen deaminase, dipyromethane cofactor binding domain/Porphobilinogen deaminase, C-terminal domain
VARLKAEGARADCEVGAVLAGRLRLPEAVSRSVRDAFERFDGLGVPAGRAGGEIETGARFAAVGYAAVMFEAVAGGAAAAQAVARWSGRALDPAIAAVFLDSPAELLALRGDLRCVPIRGNTDTRLGKVGSGEVNGVVLACAGLARLGCLHAVTQVFEPEEMLPAPGQGALAVECRDGEPELAALLDAVTDLASLAAVTAERSLLEALQADCSAPIGAYAAWPGGSGVVPPSKHGQLRMRAAVMSTDWRRILRAYGTAAAADARRLGRDLAEELLGQSRGPG